MQNFGGFGSKTGNSAFGSSLGSGTSAFGSSLGSGTSAFGSSFGTGNTLGLGNLGKSFGLGSTSNTPATGSLGSSSALSGLSKLSSTTQSAAPSTGPTKPPTNSIDTKFSPTQVTVQDKGGSTFSGNSMSIFANEKFKNYSNLELRTFDYIAQKKIDELPAPPSASSATTTTTTTTTTSAFDPSSFTASSLLNKTTTAGTNANKQYTSSTTEENGLTEKDIQNAQGLPNTIPAKIYTAAEFFKPKISKLKKTPISEISIKHEEENQFIDYSILFRPRTSSSHRTKTVITPIVVTAKMLNSGPPLESSTERFASSYNEDKQTNENDNIRKDGFSPLPKFSINNEFTTYPPLSKIQSLSSIKNFRISKETVATIDFLAPIDISKFDFKKDIIIRPCFVDVYRIKKNIPKKGTGLNVKAMINMHSIWPKNAMSGIRERTNNQKILSQYEETLKNFCKSKNAQFIFYMKEKGIFQFIIPDFSSGPFDLP